MTGSLRTFYILIVTQMLSLIGSEMTALAVGIRVFKDSGSATPLAMAAFFAAVPRLLASSFAGVLADRWDRRYVMIIADAGQAVGTLLLLISFASGQFEVWHLYAVSLIQAAFGTFQGPAFQASVTMLVPDEQRDRANAILQMRSPAAGLVAPALAGALFALVDATGVMVIDLLTFGAAMVVVLLVRIPRPVQTAEGRAMQGTIWQEALVGFRFLWARRPMLVMVAAATLVNFFMSMVGVLFTPYILSLTGSETTLGMLMSITSAGAIIGGIVMSIWGGTRPRVHTALPGIIVTGLFLALFGVTRSPLAMGVALFGLMFPIPMVNAAFDSILQAKTPPDLQGRVFAAVMQVALLASPVGYLLAGPLADGVFEPGVAGAAWDLFAPLVGSQAGSGMGLMNIIAGTLVMLTAAAFYAIPAVRHMEATLPDYNPLAANGESGAEVHGPTEPAPA